MRLLDIAVVANCRSAFLSLFGFLLCVSALTALVPSALYTACAALVVVGLSVRELVR